MSLSVQTQGEISAILEDYEKRIYSLEEDRRRLLADYKAAALQLASLEKRYSEILYRFSEFRK